MNGQIIARRWMEILIEKLCFRNNNVIAKPSPKKLITISIISIWFVSRMENAFYDKCMHWWLRAVHGMKRVECKQASMNVHIASYPSIKCIWWLKVYTNGSNDMQQFTRFIHLPMLCPRVESIFYCVLSSLQNVHSASTFATELLTRFNT